MKNSVEYLITLNEEHSREFCDPGNAAERALYRHNHPTEIAAGKCMDGRLHLPVMTKTALGIIQPYRNIGGRFDLGWPFFADKIREWEQYSISKGRRCLYLSTYHYAEGDVHRGCAGFKYDTEAAKASALSIRRQFDEDFGRKVLYAVTVGIETDRDGLVLHGETANGGNGEMIKLWDLENPSEAYLFDMVHHLYPAMPEQILQDFLPLIAGNIQHIQEIKNRPITEVVHKEWILGLGRGFDWLHVPNIALLIGPFDPDMDQAVATAAKLIKANIEEGRLDDDQQLVLLCSKPYRNIGSEQKTAERAAKLLAQRSEQIIKSQFPELLERMKVMVTTVDMNTRKMNVLH